MPKLQVNCKKCNKLLEVYPSSLVNGIKYCSISCASSDRIPWSKGKKFSQEYRTKISLGHKNQIPCNKGIKTGKSAWNKGLHTGYITHTPENIKKMLKRNPMSSLEKKFEKLVQENNIDLKFVGDGKVFVGKKVPDFVNENKKLAVEVFYSKHKEKFTKNGLEAWKKEREQIFNHYGWRILFFNETQVNQQEILKIQI